MYVVYICIYVYDVKIYIHMCIYSMSLYIYTHRDVRMYVCAYVCVYIYLSIYIYIKYFSNGYWQFISAKSVTYI